MKPPQRSVLLLWVGLLSIAALGCAREPAPQPVGPSPTAPPTTLSDALLSAADLPGWVQVGPFVGVQTTTMTGDCPLNLTSGAVDQASTLLTLPGTRSFVNEIIYKFPGDASAGLEAARQWINTCQPVFEEKQARMINSLKGTAAFPSLGDGSVVADLLTLDISFKPARVASEQRAVVFQEGSLLVFILYEGATQKLTDTEEMEMKTLVLQADKKVAALTTPP